ncbi:MAG TPA: hypothetical protein VMB71_04040 [Acetobacteraceae bacterium]|nr:hypothetical protein [Acetobacteraceae bacterium]
MEVICILGATPGPVTATVAHEGHVRQLALDVARHPSGGWRARFRGGQWGLRCHAVTTAVLLEAAEALTQNPFAMAAE